MANPLIEAVIEYCADFVATKTEKKYQGTKLVKTLYLLGAIFFLFIVGAAFYNNLSK